MQKNRPIRLVVDTNLWISFIISNKLAALDRLLFGQQIKILFSNELIDEIRLTIAKPKLRKYFTSLDIDAMLSAFEQYIIFIKPTSNIEICRDPMDDFLLNLAKDGYADFVVTGDKDLLDIGNYGGIEIVSFSDLITRLSSLV